MESQYYTLMAIPPFDPSMMAKGSVAGVPSYIPIMSNGICQFRAPIVSAGPPPSNLNITNVPHPALQAAAQNALEKRFRNVKVNGPQVSQQQMTQPPPVSIQSNNRSVQQQPVSSQSQQSPLATTVQTSNSESRPDSVASSLTQSTIPPTPTNLLSPNPGVPLSQMPFNQIAQATVPGPMPVVQNPQSMYPFMTPFPGFAPIQPAPELPADVMKDALCKQM